ncbi:NAD(P)-dependent oxidoreductase [Micromonospora sp. LOL_023]|uniref:NAD(P)-dependent oxidoreductase n=1 Tax=Micromonospora sp. LOL_023 TaxID=3345418 RepID=UPI003A8B0748
MPQHPCTGPRVCVYHPTIGPRLRASLAARHPDLAVELVTDVDTDPPDADGIEVLVANTFPTGLLGRCRRLRWLHLTGTGTDHVPAGAPSPTLQVSSSARVPAKAVAEFAWMGLLALAKDAVRLVDQHRRQQWRLPDALLVAGSRMALVGLGRIGAEIATRAPAFGVSVTAVTRTPRSCPGTDQVLPLRRIADAADGADHLVIAMPHTPQTRHLVNGAVLDRLPAHASVINVGRPQVLDTGALISRLTAGRLRAALLDVHDSEPLAERSELWSVPNLWITPHGAYRFPQEEQRIADVLLDNLDDFLAGRPLRDRVDVVGAASTDQARRPAAAVPGR